MSSDMEMRLSDVEMYISVEGRRALEVVRGVGGGFAIRLLELGFFSIPLADTAILRCAEGIQFVREHPERQLLIEQGQDFKLRQELKRTKGSTDAVIDEAIILCQTIIRAARQK